MKRVLKWVGIGLGGLLGLLIVAVVVLAFLGGRKLNREYAVQPEAVMVEADTAVLERGQYLVSGGCTGFHGEKLGGTVFFEDPVLGSIPAPNLTSGQGGAAGVYSDTDFVQAIRHGVDNEGKALLIMPSAAFWQWKRSTTPRRARRRRCSKWTPPMANTWSIPATAAVVTGRR